MVGSGNDKIHDGKIYDIIDGGILTIPGFETIINCIKHKKYNED